MNSVDPGTGRTKRAPQGRMDRARRSGSLRTGPALLAAMTAFLVLAVTAASPDPAGAAGARSAPIGVGVFGVHGFPVAQEDLGAGPLYGAKASVRLSPIALEGFYAGFREGDVTFEAGGRAQTIPGRTQTFYGGNLIVGGPSGPGAGFYVTGGAGRYVRTREGLPQTTDFGYNGGLGLEIRSSAGLSIDLSGRLHAVPLDAGGTRKFVALEAGVNLYVIG